MVCAIDILINCKFLLHVHNCHSVGALKIYLAVVPSFFEQQQQVSLLPVLQQHASHLHSEPHFSVAHLQPKLTAILITLENNYVHSVREKEINLPLQQSQGMLIHNNTVLWRWKNTRNFSTI